VPRRGRTSLPSKQNVDVQATLKLNPVKSGQFYDTRAVTWEVV